MSRTGPTTASSTFATSNATLTSPRRLRLALAPPRSSPPAPAVALPSIPPLAPPAPTPSPPARSPAANLSRAATPTATPVTRVLVDHARRWSRSLAAVEARRRGNAARRSSRTLRATTTLTSATESAVLSSHADDTRAEGHAVPSHGKRRSRRRARSAFNSTTISLKRIRSASIDATGHAGVD